MNLAITISKEKPKDKLSEAFLAIQEYVSLRSRAIISDREIFGEQEIERAYVISFDIGVGDSTGWVLR